MLIPLSNSSAPRAVSPTAVEVIMIPQPSLWVLEGFSLPLSLNIPNTKMAESIELIIEIATKIPAIKKVISCRGKCSKKTNKELNNSSNCFELPLDVISKALFANMANHTMVAKVGTKIVAIKNS